MSEEKKKPTVEMKPFIQTDAEGDEDDEKGSVRGVRLFTANLAVLVLLYIAAFAYCYGVIRMIEKKFALSSLETGMILTTTDIISITLVIFVGYIGQKVHKPRAIGMSMALVAIGIIFCFGGPYFYFKDAQQTDHATNNSVGMETTIQLDLCDIYAQNISSDRCRADNSNIGSKESFNTYLVFLLGAVLVGIGGVAPFPLSFAYIDENVPKRDSAAYIGVAIAAFPIGPLIGFSMAAVFTRLPEDLKDYKGMNPRDPRFIGAWWLGFLIIGGLMLIFSIPMCFFEKHYELYYKKKNKRAKNPKKLIGSGVKKNVKAFLSSMWSILSNRPLMLLIVSKMFATYMIQVVANQPRYVEAHFHLPAYDANMVSVASGALSSAIGSIAAGFFLKRMNMGLIPMVKFYTISITLVCAGLLALMLIPCDELKLAGHDGESLDLTTKCNDACGCGQQFQPVCGSDAQTYFSPCHAGCQEMRNNTLVDCSCIGNGNETTALKGTCQQNCTTQLIGYGVAFFLWSFLGAFGKVAGTIVLLRLVQEELKSLALGVNSFIYNLLGFIPAPIIYGTIIDSTCLIWQESCDGDKGGCQLYKTSDMRHLLHGVTLAFQIFSFLFAVGTWMSVKGRKTTVDREDSTKNKIYKP